MSIIEFSDLIKSIINEKNESKAKRANVKAFAELVLRDTKKFLEETKGMKFALNLEKIKELPEDVAEALGKHNGSLNLNGLKSLSEKAASHLKNHQGILNLGGLSLLSETASEYLMAHKGQINLFSASHHLFYDFNELSVPLAKLIMKNLNADNLSFRYLKSITPEVVEIINKVSLRFQGFKTISDQVAEGLGKCEGKSLRLNEIVTISDKSAQFLGSFKGKYELCLNNLESITPATSMNLSSYIGMNLELCGLKTISLEIAKNLSKFKGNLILVGVEQISSLEIEQFLKSIQKSRNESGGRLKLELNESLFESGIFDSLIQKYSIEVKSTFRYPNFNSRILF